MAVAIAPIPVGPVGQPDIQYLPDLGKYIARAARREKENLPKSLPEGFPQRLVSDLVWDGNDLASTYDWNYHLTKADLQEIDGALRQFRSLDISLGNITQETFPLPNLHTTLRAISKELHHGHGFKVIRGVPVDQYTREENIIIYTGVASHIAPIRGRQDRTSVDNKPADVVLWHIKDLSQKVDAQKIGAPAYTTEKQVFHTDSGDVVSLFAVGEAQEGGQSYLSSSWHVYNQLAEARPDLVRTLAEPWVQENPRKPGEPTSSPLLYFQPATSDSPERLIIQYARRGFTGYWGRPRNAALPPITEAQAEALDALHFLAEKAAVSLDFHKGDIQFVNNLSIFHARAGFTDSEEKQRHLLRLWLRDPELAWDTPEALQERWEYIYKGVSAEASVFPPEPTVRN